MEPIGDVAALQPVLQSLIQKGLVISLTPSGRGQIVTHALYLPEEMNKVQLAAAQRAADLPSEDRPVVASTAAVRPAQPHSTSTMAASGGTTDEVGQLRAEVGELRAEVARLKQDVQDLWANLN